MFGKREGKVAIGCIDLSKLKIHPQPPSQSDKHSIEFPTGPRKHFPVSKSLGQVVNSLTDKRPFVEVELYNVVRRGLLDSGATVTLKAWCPLIEKMKGQIEVSGVTLKAANKQPIAVLGTLEIPYTFRNRKFKHKTIIVQESSQDLILGVDFWAAAGLQISIPAEEQELLEIGNPEALNFQCELDLSERDKLAFNNILGSFLITTRTFLGKTQVLEHSIELIEGAKPFISRPYHYSPEMEKKINAELDDMLARGIVSPSKSPVCSPMVPVMKPDGSVRLCIDSRKLNALTIKDKNPVPSIPHLLARIRSVRFLSTIDLSKAFWQIPLKAERERNQMASARELTAFIIPGRGLFHFNVMPFGLCNAPATQCRLMQSVLGYDLEPNVFVFIDDILLISETIDQMLNLLREVAKRLRGANLSINLGKSRFFAKEVKYLGYMISKEGISADPEKLGVMREYPRPRNVKALRRYLGMTGYYRRLIRDYSRIASSLTDMLKKDAGPLNWTKERIEAFESLRESMCTAPVVATPDFEKEFSLQCDASDDAAGAALNQIQNEREVVIAFFSHKWGKHEKSWGATEKEAAAVLLAIKHFRCYLWGRSFVVVTDAKSLMHVKTIATDGSSRLSRWALELSNYDITIKHRAGKLSVVPDALSRMVSMVENDNTPDDFYTSLVRRIVENPAQYADYKIENNVILRYEKERNDIGCYVYRWKRYVPLSAQPDAIREVHVKLCHLGIDKCVAYLKRFYFWPRMYVTVKEVLKTCETCKATKSKPRITKVPMGASRNASSPFEVVAIDHWGPVTKSRRGNQYLLVVVDIFSKYVLLDPSPNAKAARVVKFLEEEVFLKFNPPKILLSDNFRPLVGRSMVDLLNRYSVRHWTIANYHSQGNPAERYIRTVSTAVRALVFDQNHNQRDWDKEVKRIQWAINATPSETTKKSPFFINFGREALGSGSEYEDIVGEETRRQMSRQQLEAAFSSMRENVRLNMLNAQEKFRAQYDKNARPLQFSEGERAWRYNRELSSAADHIAKKLSAKYVPVHIVRRVGLDTYEVQGVARNSVAKVHANELFKDN